MKRKITALLLALAMSVMPVSCYAADSSKINTADALNELGLFLGTGSGYDLDNGLTRAQGVTLLVRMIGMEETAGNGVYENSFTDVPDWASGYIGYAYANGITNGTGDTTFSPDASMTDYMFLTLVLRALNYSDKGENPLFVWDNPYALASELNLIETAEADTDFTRADAITVFWNAMDVRLNGTETTLAERLVEQKVFTADELAGARETQANGRKENTGVPVVPETEPEKEEPAVNPSEKNEPEVDTFEPYELEVDTSEPNEPEINTPDPEEPESDNGSEPEEDELGRD